MIENRISNGVNEQIKQNRLSEEDLIYLEEYFKKLRVARAKQAEELRHEGKIQEAEEALATLEPDIEDLKQMGVDVIKLIKAKELKFKK